MKKYLPHICVSLICLLFSNLTTSAQNVQRSVAISAYIFNFAKNVQWKNEDSLKEFHFLLIGDDGSVKTEMQKLSKAKTLRKKPIVISSSKTLKDAGNVQLIYLAKGNEDQLGSIFDNIENKNILLVSDGCQDKKLIMINFYDSEEGNLLFEINKANITNQNITILPDMILLGGTTIDVAALYYEGQQSLHSLQKQIEKTDSLLAKLDRANKMANAELEINKDSLNKLMAKIQEQKEYLEQQSLLLKQREQEIDFQILKIKKQQLTIDAQSPVLKTQARELEKGLDSLTKQKEEIATQSEKIKQQKSAILKQSQILEKQGTTIQRQRSLVYLLGVVAFIVLLLAFNIFYAYRSKKKMNEKLEIKVAERTVDLNTTNRQLKNELKERKLAEEALHISEERFRYTLENMMEGCQIIGFDWRYLYVNDSVALHGKKTKEELLEHTMMEVYPGIEETKVFGAIKQCMHERTPAHMVNEFTFPDGSSTWHELSIQPAPEGVSVLSYDITERVLAEQELIDSERRYRMLFEDNPVPLLIYELGTLRMISVNEALLQHYGYEKKAILKMRLTDLYPDEQKEAIEGLTKRLRGREYVGEWNHRKADGSLIDILVTSHDILYEDKKCRIAVINDITERKKIEAEKQKTLSQLEAVFNANTDVVALVDAEGVFLGGNKALLERWEKTYGEIIGHSAREILPETIFNSRLEKIREVIKTGNPLQFIDFYNHNWFEGRITPVKEADGAIRMVAMYTQNITDRKTAADQLQQEHDKLVDTLESMTDAFVSLDTNWCYTYMNRRAGLIFGRDPKQMIGKHIWTEFPEGIGQPFQINYEKVMNERVSISMEEYYPPYDRWFENHIFPTQSGISIFFQDISTRKKAEIALKESEEKYRTVIESATDSIVIISNGFIKFVNPALLNISGYSEEEFLDKTFIDFVTPKDKERVAEFYRKRINGEEAPASYEVTTIKKNNEEISFEITVTEFPFRGEKSELVFLHDITERKMIENKIRSLNEELEKRVELRTQQLENANKELEAFAYSVSHDLRAPLRAISGFTRILTEDYSEKIEAEGQRVCGVILNETQRMGQLIDDLLAFSRLNKTSMQTSLSDMNTVVQQVFNETRQQYSEKEVNFVCADLPASVFDLNLIRQVWVNLFSNAFKFSSKKEIIEITVDFEKKQNEFIYFIKDNGAGFDMKYVDKLFGVFQRLHSAQEFHGTGVGLAIVQRIIYRHGGKIWAESELNKGTTFYFSLPFNKETL